MAKFTIQNASVSGCALVTGEHTVCIDDFPEHYKNDPALLARLKKTIGLNTRQVANPSTTTCDLCLQAANSLLSALNVNAQEIEAIISVTQTPDYILPGNAHVLHGKLGLPKSALALDVALGCSGYVYGLWLSFMLASQGLKKVLLLTGDTLNKIVHPQDRSSAPLFGDAGSATLVEYNPQAVDSYFILQSDGTGLEKIYIPAGGARTPSTPATRTATEREEGCIRSDENFYMHGFDVFEFTMAEQPELLRQILEYSGQSIESIDYFALHQANKYIVETISSKAKIPAHKAPTDCFTKYGNQNSASIPGVLCGSLAGQLRGQTVKAVLQGYGVGLSWGACQTTLNNVLCLEPEAYKGGCGAV